MADCKMSWIKTGAGTVDGFVAATGDFKMNNITLNMY